MPEIGVCQKCGRTIRYEDINEEPNEEKRLPPGNKKGPSKINRATSVLVEGDPSCQHHFIIEQEDQVVKKKEAKQPRRKSIDSRKLVSELSEDELTRIVDMYDANYPVGKIVSISNLRSPEAIYRVLSKKGRSPNRGQGVRPIAEATPIPEAEEPTRETLNPPLENGKIPVPESSITTALNIIVMLRNSYSLDDDEIRRIVGIMAAALDGTD